MIGAWNRHKKKAYYALTAAIFYLGMQQAASFLAEKDRDIISAEMHKKYALLQNLADIDRDGKLSRVEKSLMVSRIDRNQVYPEMPWEVIENSPYSWNFKVIKRVDKAIEMYEKKRIYH